MIIVAVFVLSLLLGFPIIMVIAITSFVYIMFQGIPPIVIAQRIFVGMDSFVLLAIPLYILMGNIMTEGGITKKLISWCNLLVGHVRGGLGHVNVLVSIIFAGISGSGSADVSAIGNILIPAMVREGYDREFSTAITAASSCISPIIPPSIIFVIYGVVAEVSISHMFAGGIIPGLIMGGLQMLMVWYLAKRRNYPKREERASLSAIFKGTREAILSLVGPGIILFGILGGIFTPTEAGAVAVVYSLILGLFIYKELNWSKLPHIIWETALTTAAAYFLVGTSMVFAWILAAERIPQIIAQAITSITNNPVIILLLFNLLFLIVGTMMEAISAIIILTPILLPVASTVGIDPIHLGVVMCVNLAVGFITPPVGCCMFIACMVGKITVERFIKAIWPFLLTNIVTILIISLFPKFILWPTTFLK